jgi:L-ascorbate metabolism protein UlaG (beta-lactamase superfamily)
MTFKIVGSNSSGNAIIYHEEILVDCGVSYKKIEPYLDGIKAVLLTHEHGDHFKASTVRMIAVNHRSIKFVCPPHMVNLLTTIGVKNILEVEHGKVYKLDPYYISPVLLYHNVPNYGYRIFKGEHKLFHATDTNTLEGISAKNYDNYFIEFNYDENTIWDVINAKETGGEFSYERDAINNHLSWQKANRWLKDNASENSVVVKLHISDRYTKEEIANAENCW